MTTAMLHVIPVQVVIEWITAYSK